MDAAATEDATAELEAALAGLRHDRYGYYGAMLRDLLLHAVYDDLGPVRSLDYRVLRFVDAQVTGAVTVSHVSELLLCDRARASRVVHRLAEAGLIELRVPASDARKRRLVLTPMGRRLLTAAASARRTHLRASLAHWDDRDIRVLARLISRLNEDAQRHFSSLSSLRADPITASESIPQPNRRPRDPSRHKKPREHFGGHRQLS
ncbi:MAG: MarR family winged helix-turn-helix transcriptional regulator [Actinomycetota bacterium]|nr:MarR family winged helix-turn-helix transcriptional regulator [Actinomycetota bacterium]